MTWAQHNYTNPFRRDRVRRTCCMCTRPVIYVITGRDGRSYRVCEEHMPYAGQEAADVPELPGGAREGY